MEIINKIKSAFSTSLTSEDVERMLVKTPFRRPMPSYGSFIIPSNGMDVNVPMPSIAYENISQDLFLTEIDPSGHKINDTSYYADRIKKDDDGKLYIHYMERTAFPIQDIILTKQLTHLAGNQINFINGSVKQTDKEKDLMVEFKQAWLTKNMEVALFESYKMEKSTGDTAFCAYIDENKNIGWRTFGYSNGETLFPSYDAMTGKPNSFARRYVSNGKLTVDVWNSTMFYSFESDNGKWVRKVRKPHGFTRLPIAYKRSDVGACWTLVQDIIDKFEIAISQLCESNKTFAFRIMFISGDEVDIRPDSSGVPSVIVGDKDSDAKMLEGADASTSFELQIKTLSNMMFMGSFVVTPPEVKGGDLPGVTIKILYSPAVEKAMRDAKEWNMFVDDVVSIFKEGYGIESGKITDFKTLKVRGEIVPYVHQNDTEVVNNINSSVTMGSLSVETATEMHPYSKNDEYDRVKKDQEAEQSAQVKPNITNPTNAAREAASI